MNVVFTEIGWATYRQWLQRDRAILKRANLLIEDARRDPFSGIGKPEPLKFQAAGTWSRRITPEHRLVYRVDGEALVILQVGTHYR